MLLYLYKILQERHYLNCIKLYLTAWKTAKIMNCIVLKYHTKLPIVHYQTLDGFCLQQICKICTETEPHTFLYIYL